MFNVKGKWKGNIPKWSGSYVGIVLQAMIDKVEQHIYTYIYTHTHTHTHTHTYIHTNIYSI